MLRDVIWYDTMETWKLEGFALDDATTKNKSTTFKLNTKLKFASIYYQMLLTFWKKTDVFIRILII
jgi:hypothetical protein